MKETSFIAWEEKATIALKLALRLHSSKLKHLVKYLGEFTAYKYLHYKRLFAVRKIKELKWFGQYSKN